MPNKNTKTRPYREALLEALADPVEAAHYLNAALDDSAEMFRKACLNVIQARQVAKTAREAGVTRESLYRSFSTEGNPTFDTLNSVLNVLDLKLAIAPLEPLPSTDSSASGSQITTVRRYLYDLPSSVVRNLKTDEFYRPEGGLGRRVYMFSWHQSEAAFEPDKPIADIEPEHGSHSWLSGFFGAVGSEQENLGSKLGRIQ